MQKSALLGSAHILRKVLEVWGLGMRLDWIFLPRENPCAKFCIIITRIIILSSSSLLLPLLLLLLLLLFQRLAEAVETKTEIVGTFNHPDPHVRDRVHVEFLSEVIEIEKIFLGGPGNMCDAVNVLVIYFVMFPFGNYQKSSQERQNSRGSPAIRRPDLYNPAEVDIRFLTFENPAKAVKQPPLYIHQCMFLYWTVDLMTSWPHPVHPEILPFLPRMPFSPNIASHAKILTNLALRSRGQIPYPVDEFCIFF